MTQFEFVQSGFSTSLERYIPLYKDKKEISNLIFVVAIVYLIFGLFFSSGVYILDYYKLFSFLNSKDIYDFLILLIYFVPLIWFFKTFSFALRAFKDFRTENLVNISFLLIEAVLVYIAIKNNYKLNEILFINLICVFLRYCTHAIFVFTRHRFNIFFVRVNSLISQFEKVKSYSFWNFISSASGSIVNVSDKLLVSIFLGPSSLAVYYGINQFVKFNAMFSSVLNASIIPHFSYKIRESSNQVFNKLALKGSEYTSFIFMTISGVFILFSQFIFTSISKDFLLDYIVVFNICMLIFVYLGGIGFVTKMYKCNYKSAKYISILNLITSLIYPIVFICLSTFFGLYGAILSPVLAHLLIHPFWIKIVFNTTKLSVKKYLKIISFNMIKIFSLIGPMYIFNSTFDLYNEYSILLIEFILIVLFIYLAFKKLIINLLYLNKKM